MQEMWITEPLRESLVEISELQNPDIYIGTDLIWLQDRKKTFVFGIHNNYCKFHVTYINEKKKTTYLCVETEEPINPPKDIGKYLDEFILDIFTKIISQLNKGIGVNII
ncbi:MAG: hypothetical protein Tp1124SUR272871_14 [Prokaryotic dsDNA virus sp.]|nr:MAG: hypothetical protein Tp1125SUR00d2C35834131_24 [Prokaryotic dsDNA virus sp.]QDP67334.1 MAG: hypothetical protein Tp1124SUR272871_14 [Prokaryotic dsDNA virus sp.]|tara:strand:+ start:164 stop:490 length:327 start_codon:yes stop_codon:yes gene_type:complete